MRHIYIIGIAWLLFASCGQQYQAKTIVKEFVEESLRHDADYLDFTSLDSTRAISDSIIDVLHRQASKDIKYCERKEQTLMFMRTTYLLDRDTMSATFYLDKELTGVVAFKKN
jgi:hypothetical protein